MIQNLIFVAVCLIAALIIFTLLRSGNALRALVFSAVSGNAALLSVGWLGGFTGVCLAPNVFTVCVATALGLPGVLWMLAMRLIFAA